MLDLEEQLRLYGEAVEDLVLQQQPPRRSRRPLVLATVAAVVVVLGVTGLILATRSEKPTKLQIADTPAPPTVDSYIAQDLCETKGRTVAGPKATLRAAFESSRTEVEAWQRTRNGPDGPAAVSDFVGRLSPSNFRMVVCYFDDGAWPVPLPPGAPVPDRAIVLAAADFAELDVAGSKATLEIRRPSKGPPLTPAAARYVGHIHHGDDFPGPEGAVARGGALLGYQPSFAPFGVEWFQEGAQATLLFQRPINHDPQGKPIWLVIDVLELELAEGEALFVGRCFPNGRLEDHTVVVADVAHPVKDERGVFLARALRAWRFDPATESTTPMDPSGMLCDTGIGQ